jgi:hypothetical protein
MNGRLLSLLVIRGRRESASLTTFPASGRARPLASVNATRE